MSGTGPAGGPAPTRLRLLRRVRRRPAAVEAAGRLLAWDDLCWRRSAFVAAARRVPRILLVVLIAFVLAVGLDPAVRYLERLRVRCDWDGCKAGPRQGLTLLGPVSRRDKGPGPAGDKPGDKPTLLHPDAVPQPRWSDQPRAYLL